MQEGKSPVLNWGPNQSQAGHKGDTETPVTYLYHGSFFWSQRRVNKPFVQIKPFLLNKAWSQNSHICLGKTRLKLDFCDTGGFFFFLRLDLCRAVWSVQAVCEQ